jgi:hypothetical protein
VFRRDEKRSIEEKNTLFDEFPSHHLSFFTRFTTGSELQKLFQRVRSASWGAGGHKNASPNGGQ